MAHRQTCIVILRLPTTFWPPLEMFGADQFADSAVVIKCSVKTRPIKPWRVGREMSRRIKKTFDAKGIEIPFPYQTIYRGEPKHGMPPPLYIAELGQNPRAAG